MGLPQLWFGLVAVLFLGFFVLEGVDFGVVSHLFSTGANDVLVARGDRERMVPFVEPDYIRSVDFDAGLVTVDWDADF